LSDHSIAGQRTSALVTAILGFLALMLASIGVYGVMAYSVSRREREFGIRIALGSDRGRILRLLFSSVSRLVLAGVLLGAVFAIAARASIESLLGGDGNTNAALILAGALLSMVAMMAALIPVRRAMNVEPMVALRNE
jgi:putative ABC transport system permease protein